MGNYTKFLFLSLLLLGLPLFSTTQEYIHFKGDYFLYSDDLHYLYGSGNIQIKKDSVTIHGNEVYFDLNRFQGVIYGKIRIIHGKKEYNCDTLFFKPFPLTYLCEHFLDWIVKREDHGISNSMNKLTLEQLKKSDLYWEFDQFKMDQNGKIIARNVFPYILTMPSIPFKKFTITRGSLPEKTQIFFKNIGISSSDEISLNLLARLREKIVRGEFNLKLYERELFNKDTVIKRGVQVSGESSLMAKKKKFMNLSTLLNTGDQSFNLTLDHKKELKTFHYSISQNISGRKDVPVVYNFSSSITLTKLKVLEPSFGFTHNLKHSYSYNISTPLKIWKKLRLNFNLERKILKDEVESSTLNFSTTANFSSSLLNLSSAFNLSKNIIEATQSRNFSLNFDLKPLYFLDKNVSITISPYYMYSTIPADETSLSRTSPGINAEIKSIGVVLPLQLLFIPSVHVNHIWDNMDVDQTEFKYMLSLKKEVDKFAFSLDYSLNSRYRSGDLWVEGYNVRNLIFNTEFKDKNKFCFNMRFYFDNDMALENLTFSGEIFFPWDIKFSSFLLYYVEQDKFQTVEIFIEKKFGNHFKIQGGYSLALKKFFLKLVSL